MWRLLAAVAAAGGAAFLAKKISDEIGSAGSAGVSPAGPVGTGTVLVPRGLLKLKYKRIPRDLWCSIVLRDIPLQRLAVWSQECGRAAMVRPFWASRDNHVAKGTGESALPAVWDVERPPALAKYDKLRLFKLHGRTTNPFRDLAIGHGGNHSVRSLMAPYVTRIAETSSHSYRAGSGPPFINRLDAWNDLVQIVGDIPIVGDILTEKNTSGGTAGRWAVYSDELGLMCFPPQGFQSKVHYKAWLAARLLWENDTGIWHIASGRLAQRYGGPPGAEVMIKTSIAAKHLYHARRSYNLDEDYNQSPGVLMYNWITMCASMSALGLLPAGGNATMGSYFKDPWAAWVTAVGGTEPKDVRGGSVLGATALKMLGTLLQTSAATLAGGPAAGMKAFSGSIGQQIAQMAAPYAKQKGWWHDDWTPVAIPAADLGSETTRLIMPPDWARSDEVRSQSVPAAHTSAMLAVQSAAAAVSVSKIEGSSTTKAAVKRLGDEAPKEMIGFGTGYGT